MTTTTEADPMTTHQDGDSIYEPSGEVDALQMVTRDRDEWKRRALRHELPMPALPESVDDALAEVLYETTSRAGMDTWAEVKKDADHRAYWAGNARAVVARFVALFTADPPELAPSDEACLAAFGSVSLGMADHQRGRALRLSRVRAVAGEALRLAGPVMRSLRADLDAARAELGAFREENAGLLARAQDAAREAIEAARENERLREALARHGGEWRARQATERARVACPARAERAEAALRAVADDPEPIAAAVDRALAQLSEMGADGRNLDRLRQAEATLRADAVRPPAAPTAAEASIGSGLGALEASEPSGLAWPAGELEGALRDLAQAHLGAAPEMPLWVGRASEAIASVLARLRAEAGPPGGSP